MKRLLALALAASCASRAPKPTTPPAEATLFFTVGLQGYVEPCGCSENMRGGIARLAGQLEAARAEGRAVLAFDVGDGLFGAATLPPEAVAQQERKAVAVAEVWRKVGLTGRLPGPFDDARGAPFRKALALPELALGRVHLESVAGARVAVVAATSADEAERLAREARAAQAVFVVALITQPLEALLPLALGEGTSADLVLPAVVGPELKAEESRLIGGATKLAQPQSKGRSLLRVDLSLVAGAPSRWRASTSERDRELSALAQRIELLRAEVNRPGLDPELKALKQGKLEELMGRRETLSGAPLPAPGPGTSAQWRFVPLEKTSPESPAVAALVAAYDADVGALNLAWAKANAPACEPPAASEASVVGSEACAACHPAAQAAWAGTKHARAYRDLATKGKQYHLDCVGCHVTGWKKPGGVCRVDQTAGREAVGCEACHGPGSAHLAQPSAQTIRRAAPATTCVACHDRENSPHFEYERFVGQLLVPGHGLPPAAPAP